MTVTEEEAKKKICRRFPVCVEVRKEGESEQPSYDFMPSFCVASACMMWIWDTAEETKGYCGLMRRMSSYESCSNNVIKEAK